MVYLTLFTSGMTGVVGFSNGLVYFECRGVLLIWILVEQGPIVLAVRAGKGRLEKSPVVSLFLILLSDRRPY